MTPGLEAFGVVEAAGEGVDLAPGTRVGGMAALPGGGYAEAALVRAHTALVFPAEIPPAHASALYSTYQTSHVALFHRARLRSGEWLLVHAAAGGVGSAAVQLGVAAGAQVIATAGSAEKRAACAGLGAQHVLDYRSDALRKRVMALTGGRGVDVVYDPVGGEVAETSRRLLAWEGRYLVIGFAGGEIPLFPANHVLVKNYSVIGVHWGRYPDFAGRAVIEAAHADLMKRYATDEIRPLVSRTVELEGVPAALAAIENRQVIGRYVMCPAG